MDQLDTPSINIPKENTSEIDVETVNQETEIPKDKCGIPNDQLVSDDTPILAKVIDTEDSSKTDTTDDTNIKQSVDNAKETNAISTIEKLPDTDTQVSESNESVQSGDNHPDSFSPMLDTSTSNEKSLSQDNEIRTEDSQSCSQETVIVDNVDTKSSACNINTNEYLHDEETINFSVKKENQSDKLIEDTTANNNTNNQEKWIVTDSNIIEIMKNDSASDIPVETESIVKNEVAMTVDTSTDKEEVVEEIIEVKEVLTIAETEDKHNLSELSDKDNICNDCNLVNYDQESTETIEIVSMEVIDTNSMEKCIEEDNKENEESNKCDDTTVTITGEPQIENNEQVLYNKDVERNPIEDNIDDESEKDMQVKEIQEIKEVHVTHFHISTETHVNKDQNQIENKISYSASCISSEKLNMEIDKSNKSSEPSTPETSTKNRSVIQDIFDDWGVENTDEDVQSAPKIQDLVEIELKSLLDDTKNQQSVEKSQKDTKKSTTDFIDNETISTPATPETPSKLPEESLQKDIDRQLAETILSSAQKNKSSPLLRSRDSIKIHETPTTPKNRISNMKVATQVTEVLKERLREKQKIMEAQRPPDPFFVKKIAQRLSSKLVGSPVSSIPALIPLPHSTPSSTDSGVRKSTGNPIADPKDKDSNKEKTGKDRNSDNKELLAILEGDVDPDWSNLKPPTLIEEDKPISNVDHVEHSAPPKLDPLVEREIALKQLLELPPSPVKKTTPKKKKTFKPPPSKMSKEAEIKITPIELKQEIVNIDLIEEEAEPVLQEEPIPKVDLTIETESESPNSNSEKQESRFDESRSGRKRKLTEKAREHEITVKRQKVYKTKVPIRKSIQPSENSNTLKIEDTETDDVLSSQSKPDVNIVDVPKPMNEQLENKDKPVSTPLNKSENLNTKQSKQNATKKGLQSVAKKKVVMKKLTQEKASPKKSIEAKTKATPLSKKSVPQKVRTKSQKRSIENNTVEVKPKKKNINEIDRLLQDEGVVNLLYDVEQPDKKRLVPITKSQTKVMDIQKVQHELNIRKKLVRNAVLRLRTSTGSVAKVSSRSKRSVVQGSSKPPGDKKTTDQKSLKGVTSDNQTEFIIPAKIRNAADASVIIRRHSSSSFSSASGSPRVSIDAPEKQTPDINKSGESGLHSLRSAKRRLSQEEKINTKKIKKKMMQKGDAIFVDETNEDKASVIARSKKVEPKKSEKNTKLETVPVNAKSNATSKVVTRSNGATTAKVAPKNKKSAKSKVTFAKTNEEEINEDSSKEEDKLSACLAEAATALSIGNAASRSGNSSVNLSTNIMKMHSDADKAKADTQCQISNKEITVRQHGNLVQLILTPSTPTKIKNALTLQVMQEFREILSILKEDDSCRVVLLTSTGTSFCEGLELSSLIRANKKERRVSAVEMAIGVKKFIKCLAAFNKPIVAGVQGAAVGLGVTMLPLFDLVIASDKATFSTPYGKLGQVAEGVTVFTLSHTLGSIARELLLSGRTLTASEALRAGLVTRVLWPDRFQVDLLPSLRAMSEQSSQSMEATKALLCQTLHENLDAVIESETHVLIQHWCSTECQAAIKAYIDGKDE